MALRQEELVGPGGAAIYRFPTTAVRRRAARARVAQRRRRALAALIVAGSTTVLLFATGPSGVAPAATGSTPKRVVVQAGDTLWELAGRYAPEGIDTRAWVDAVVELNGLEGA